MKIGLINNKGGVLKTSLVTNLAASLFMDNKKVVMVDLDGQGNVAATFGIKPDTIKKTVLNFLKRELSLDECLIKLKEGFHILPANNELNYFDILARAKEVNPSDLRTLLNKLNELYDYVIIDTPPAMSSLVATTMSVVDAIIIPFEPDQYSILGLKRIVDASKEFKKLQGSNLKVIAVPTKVNARVNIHNDIINNSVKPKMTSENVYVTNGFISSSTRSTAAVGYERVPIVMSIFKNKYQEEYHKIKNEILEYLKG